jgi:hypothetical protein
VDIIVYLPVKLRFEKRIFKGQSSNPDSIVLTTNPFTRPKAFFVFGLDVLALTSNPNFESLKRLGGRSCCRGKTSNPLTQFFSAPKIAL